MKKISTIILLLILAGCGSNNELATHTGNVTDLIEEENGTRIFVEESEDNTIAFLITDDLNDGIELDNNVTVYYDSTAMIEESLPPNQGGVERVEIN